MANSILQQTFESAWTRSQLEQRYLSVTPGAIHQFQELLSNMLYPNPRLRPASERLMRSELGQPGLWSLGISGDLPILTVLVADEKALPLAREVLLAQTYWRLQGFRADVVIVDQEGASYDQPLQSRLRRVLEAHSLHTGIDVPGGAYLRDWNALTEVQRSVLLAASRVVLVGSRGLLARQLAAIGDPVNTSAGFARKPSGEEPRYGSSNLPFMELDYFNGHGGFSRPASEYCVYLDGDRTTPRPWVNVIAGPAFGTLVTESGLGFTWSGNSQANRLTPWRNDPVSDEPSEILYIRDDDSGHFWSPTSQPARNADPYRVRHGMGYTVFEHNHHGLDQELTVFVPKTASSAEPLKVHRLQIANRTQSTRKLSIFHFVEWVLGSTREESQLHVRCGFDEESGALHARNSWSHNYASRIAFLACSPAPSSFTTDRTRFLGRNGSYRAPQALQQTNLDKRMGTVVDPCGALQTSLTLQPGETKTIVALLGQAADLPEMRELVSRFSKLENTNESFAQTKEHWRSVLATIQVNTPIHSVNLLLNGWLNYQSLSCRFWGRSAYYQSGGAFGFRDQLQDCMGIVYFNPRLTREHILRSAARQYPEGDVQHWWHAETGMGVRTKCSDDLLWLPYVTAHYVSITGDIGILEEMVPFISGPELSEGHLEQLQQPQVDLYSASLLEHCLLAIRHSEGTGVHGLPLMGNGDWNDGMNLVGREGRGESVWLTWFLIVVLRQFSKLLRRVGNETEAVSLEAKATELLASAEAHCWDGAWYLRAFFDDGSPLGSHKNTEARIDSIAQSWAVMAGVEASRGKQAVDSALKILVNEQHSLVHLFWPPFENSTPHPGYIMGYPPGLRENGGQYTHGSLWLAQACAILNNGDDAVRLLQIMNPVERTRDPEGVARYGGEPYVAAADVYAAPGHQGRAGWSWYTGSASWMYRIWLENVLGFCLEGDFLYIRPVVPDSWNEYTITYRHHQAIYDIQVRRATSALPRKVILDGQSCEGAIPLVKQAGHHRVEVYF